MLLFEFMGDEGKSRDLRIERSQAEEIRSCAYLRQSEAAELGERDTT